jgi:hypothetical protein
MTAFPLLSEYDPGVSAEGSLDPLGLYGIADNLAVRMIPGVRERQQHPRFLTVMCVSLTVCSEFEEGLVAADRVSEPWQVFEWYVVEGLVRTLSSKKDLVPQAGDKVVDLYPGLTKIDHLHGLPGRNKTAKAIQEGVPLSAKRYLKTPSVFGFHGVYRALAKELEVELGGRLGEAGYELMSVWQDEQGLPGFLGSEQGEGRRWLGILRGAVEAGLKQGAVARGQGWQGWRFFRDHLAHLGPGPQEARLLVELLSRGHGGFRRQVSEFLASGAGLRAWSYNSSERHFHKALIEIAEPELKDLLEAIEAYELFCRLLQDAFDDCLHHLSMTRSKGQPAELAELAGVRRAAQEAPALHPEVAERLEPYDLVHRLEEGPGVLGQELAPRDWVEALMDHHRRVQAQKPPQGKAPWLDRFDDGGYMVRPLYLRDQGGRHDDEYLHGYRTGSLASFLQDLGAVQS